VSEPGLEHLFGKRKVPRVSGLRRAPVGMTVIMVLVAFVLGHELDYLIVYGSGVGIELTRTGHGAAWWVTVASVLCLAGAMGVLAVRRLGQLSRLAAAVDAGHLEVREADGRHLAGRVLRLWPAIFVASLALFLAGENAERVLAGLTAPGLDVVAAGDLVTTLLVFLGVSLAAAGVSGLYRWRCEVLAARIAGAACAATHPSRPARLSPPFSQIPASAPQRRRLARAPPTTLALRLLPA
jgi:hypothetical protein